MRVRITAVAAACAAVALLAPAGASAHGTHLKATMTGEQVVGSKGSPNGAGVARTHVLKQKRKVCSKVRWSGIGTTKDLFIGIYSGGAGENGGLLVTLAEGQAESPIEGCTRGLPGSTVRQIARHPKLYHLNVKTRAYPEDGAIRGQLRAVKK